jgi:hypothetical protein
VRWRESKKTAQKETDQSLPEVALMIQGDRATPLEEVAREEQRAHGCEAVEAELADHNTDTTTPTVPEDGGRGEPGRWSTPLRCVRCRCIIDVVVPEGGVPQTTGGPELARAGPMAIGTLSRHHG